MSEAATPAAPEAVTPPATPAATPAVAETVTLPKEEADQLKRDAARAGSAQSENARLRRMLFGNNKPTFGAATPAPAPSQEEVAAKMQEEERKAESGLKNLVLDPKYREVLDADTTLRDLFMRNPLGVIPVLASDPFDAEDAIGQVKAKLDERLAAKKPATPAAPAAPAAAAPAAPAPGAPAPSAPVSDEEYENARKLPNTEDALRGMIGIGLKKMGGKNGS